MYQADKARRQPSGNRLTSQFEPERNMNGVPDTKPDPCSSIETNHDPIICTTR